MIYTSKDNPLIKMLCSLKDKKGRREHNMFIAEGVKLVNAAVMYKKDIGCIVKREGFDFDCGYPGIEVSDRIFAHLSSEKTPQGVLAAIKYEEKPLLDITGNCVISDGISDPGNLGTVIRTAAACGVNNLILCEGSADVYSPKTVRASMGGLFCMNIYRAERGEVIDRVKLPLLCADLNGENIFKIKTPKNFALVVGGEAAGVSDFFKERCSKKITLPMKNDTESLNAAVAAGIILYKLTLSNDLF